MDRYTGREFVGFAAGILTIARTRNGERWAVETIDQEELQVWDDILNGRLQGVQIESALNSMVRFGCAGETASRFWDFLEGAALLRDALTSEQTHAGFRLDDGDLCEVRSQFWTGSRAPGIILSGVARLEGKSTPYFLFFPKSDLEKLCSKLRPDLAVETKIKRGRPAAINPSNVRDAVFHLMDENGDFVPEDAAWNAQARLEDAVRAKLKTKVAPSTLRDYIVPHLFHWRASKRDPDP